MPRNVKAYRRKVLLCLPLYYLATSIPPSPLFFAQTVRSRALPAAWRLLIRGISNALPVGRNR
jgi:hypothetical protein